MLKSNEIRNAITKLRDEVCSFERSTDRKYTTIFVPHSFDEEVYMDINGKPVQDSSPWEVLFQALVARK